MAELVDEEQVANVVENYFLSKDGSSLENGIFVQSIDFRNFHQIKAQQQIDRLKTQYNTYHKYKLGEVVREIRRVKAGGSFGKEENAIYVPAIGQSPVVSNLSETTLKHHNYFQVVLEDEVDSTYLAAFFRSALGKLVLSTSATQSLIPHMNKSDLSEILVALPAFEEQRSIANTLDKLAVLKKAIGSLDTELALNPTASDSVLGQLDGMLEAVNALTRADKVRGIIREGETKRIEFKESLSLDVKEGSKKNELAHSALKTIAAFLNSDGGVLLIGISDEGKVAGLKEIEMFHKSADAFLVYWTNLVRKNIGSSFYPLVDHNLVEVDGKMVLMVKVRPSEKPFFWKTKELKSTEFYVRTNPATDKLEGEELYLYVNNRFPK